MTADRGRLARLPSTKPDTGSRGAPGPQVPSEGPPADSVPRATLVRCTVRSGWGRPLSRGGSDGWQNDDGDGSRRRQRLLKGYAPLVVLVAALVVMVAIVPSKVPAELGRRRRSRGRGARRRCGRRLGHAGPVPDRPEQAPDLDYSPPCFTFSGDNGGATSRGVTADRSWSPTGSRPTPTCSRLLGQLAGVPIDDDNQRPQADRRGGGRLLQRQLPVLRPEAELVGYDGRGQIMPEFNGGGRTPPQRRLRPPTRSAPSPTSPRLTQPYADALTRNGSCRRGALHVPRVVRAPPALRLEHVPRLHGRRPRPAEYANKRLLGRRRPAGGDLQGEPRTLAVIAPNNLEYQQCVDASTGRSRTPATRSTCASTTCSTSPSSRPRRPA